jgi:hypothetical protein
MGKFTVMLLAGASALVAGGAKAADITTTGEYASPELVQQVRLVCDDGRCYRTRGGHEVIVRDSYGYDVPRERYVERRRYRDWDDGPRAGFGIRAPGVSVGVGVDNDRW